MNIETKRYLALSMPADARALPVLSEKFAAEIDNYAEKSSSKLAQRDADKRVTMRLEKIVDTLNRMIQEAEAYKSEMHNGDKIEPGPRVRLVSGKPLSATELTDTIYQVVVETVKATGERPEILLDESCRRNSKVVQISTLLRWLLQRQPDSVESNPESH